MHSKQLAEDGMVDIRQTRCIHGSCTRRPNIYDVRSNTASLCKNNVEDGIANVLSVRS